jgi:hypothetical protein
MIKPVRDRAVSSFATACLLAAAAGCSSSMPTLTCADTIENACAAAGSCVPTWDDAQSDTAWCVGATELSPLRVDCGAYHVVTVKVGNDSRTFYYDATVDAASNGALVAMVTAHSASATTTCDAGPATGFTIPTCSGKGSEPLPQCFDGGTDAGGDAATF